MENQIYIGFIIVYINYIRFSLYVMYMYYVHLLRIRKKIHVPVSSCAFDSR